MFCTDEERQAKRVRVETFVDSFLTGLRSSTSNLDVQAAINQTRLELCSGLVTSAQAIKNARRQLGENDESYLQLSVMVLWSGEGSDDKHLLYPASANTERDMNESTLRSMARVAEDDYNQILRQIETTKSHFAYYLAIPEIRAWLFSLAFLENRKWYLDKFLELLRSKKQPAESIDTFDEQVKLLKDERYNEVDVWMGMIKQAIDDDDKVIFVFRAFSLICDPYQEVILDGLFCVKNDTLKACSDADLLGTRCDELNVLSKTNLRARYEDTLFGSDTSLGTFDIAASKTENALQASKFKCSFAYFDDDLSYCKTRTVPVFSDIDFKDFKELIKGTRLIEWLRGERISIDADVVSEQKLIELCSGQSQLRAFSSCFLSVSRGLTCSVPPHLLVEAVSDSYSLPISNDDANLLAGSITNDTLNIKWSQPGKIISMWQTVYEYSKLLSLDSIGKKSTNRYCRCLWTPTVVNTHHISSTPTVGNVAINQASLATSYCTMLSELHQSFRQPEHFHESTFVEAVCKLEMLNSLRVLNQYSSASVQSLISSDSMSASVHMNLAWFHSTNYQTVAKPTGVAS